MSYILYTEENSIRNCSLTICSSFRVMDSGDNSSDILTKISFVFELMKISHMQQLNMTSKDDRNVDYC